MCFGWIDSTVKRLDNGVTVQRLAPRKKNSLWSELNKERCRRMEKTGRMTDAGRAVLPDMSPEGFKIDSDILNALQSDKTVWENFSALPPLYRRVRIDTIQNKKSSPSFSKAVWKNLSKTQNRVKFTANGTITDACSIIKKIALNSVFKIDFLLSATGSGRHA